MSPRTSPGAVVDEDRVWLTLDEAAEKLSIARESVRKMARRKRWAKLGGNDGLVRIGVPVDRLSRVPGQDPGKIPGQDPGPLPGRVPGQDQEGAAAPAPEGDPPLLVLRFMERLETAQGELVETTKRLGAAEARVSMLEGQLDALRQDRDALRQERDRWASMAEELARRPKSLWGWFRRSA